MKRAAVAVVGTISTAAFAYSVYALGLAHIQVSLGQVGWGFAVILLLSGLREAGRALAWSRVVEAPFELPLGEAFWARLAGEALNTLLPMGMVVGEPAKAHHVTHRLPFATAFGALMIELAFYSVSVVALFVAAAVMAFPASIVLAIVALLIAFVMVARFRKSPRIFQPLLAFAARQRRRVWLIAALELSFHALSIAEVYVTLVLISPVAPAFTSAIALEIVNRGVAVVFKMLPMRIGVDEASAAMVAHQLALGSSTGVMLALIRKLRILCWCGIGLAFTLSRAIQVRGQRAVHV
jgi:hypothetical protein